MQVLGLIKRNFVLTAAEDFRLLFNLCGLTWNTVYHFDHLI